MIIVKTNLGIKFILGYIIDIFILLKNSIYSVVTIYIYYLPKFIFEFIYNLFSKLTNKYDMRIIIIETFNISIIFGLLRTYYLALIQYGQNYNLDFYSVLVTSIVIPIILQILNNIFDKEKNNNKC